MRLSVRLLCAVQGHWGQDLEDEMSCAVCQDTIVAAHSLVPCGHWFCGSCLLQWLPRKQICPTCRRLTQCLPELLSAQTQRSRHAPCSMASGPEQTTVLCGHLRLSRP